MKSFRPKGEPPTHRPTTDGDPGNPSVDFRGEKRTNVTHCSTTDPEARLMRKANGQQARLCFSAHALMENRNGLLVDLKVALATGFAERETTIEMRIGPPVEAAALEQLGSDDRIVNRCECAPMPSPTAGAWRAGRRTTPPCDSRAVCGPA